MQFEPSDTMAEVFGGVFSVSLPDRRERSAKRLEEVANDTGPSLTVVPMEPPPLKLVSLALPLLTGTGKRLEVVSELR